MMIRSLQAELQRLQIELCLLCALQLGPQLQHEIMINLIRDHLLQRQMEHEHASMQEELMRQRLLLQEMQQMTARLRQLENRRAMLMAILDAHTSSTMSSAESTGIHSVQSVATATPSTSSATMSAAETATSSVAPADLATSENVEARKSRIRSAKKLTQMKPNDKKIRARQNAVKRSHP